MPLWASYLVKVFAWRTIFQGNGILSLGAGAVRARWRRDGQIANSWIVFSYLWLPYMILPIYAGLERSLALLEASADLGEGRGGPSGA